MELDENGDPLPPGWQMFMDTERNVPYYYNAELEKTQWEVPSDDEDGPVAGAAAARRGSSVSVPSRR